MCIKPGTVQTSAVLGLISMMGFLGVALVWVTQSRINTTNFYVSSLNLQSFGSRILRTSMARVAWVAVVGVAVFILMLTDVISYLLTALNYQTVFVAGWVAIACVHVASVRGGFGIEDERSEFRPGRLTMINPAGFSAWIVSSATGTLMLVFGGVFGTTWAVPIVFCIAALLYWGLNRIQPTSWASLDRPNDPRDEVSDPWEERVACHLCEKSYLAIEFDRDPSHGHEAICCRCAESSSNFYKAAKAESSITGAGADHLVSGTS